MSRHFHEVMMLIKNISIHTRMMCDDGQRSECHIDRSYLAHNSTGEGSRLHGGETICGGEDGSKYGDCREFHGN